MSRKPLSNFFFKRNSDGASKNVSPSSNVLRDGREQPAARRPALFPMHHINKSALNSTRQETAIDPVESKEEPLRRTVHRAPLPHQHAPIITHQTNKKSSKQPSNEYLLQKRLCISIAFLMLSMAIACTFLFISSLFETSPAWDTKRVSQPVVDVALAEHYEDRRPFVTVGPCYKSDLDNPESECDRLMDELSGNTAPYKDVDKTPFDQVGSYGYHNSYHNGSWLRNIPYVRGLIPGEWKEYHPPFVTQWDSLATQFEFDLNSRQADPWNTTFHVMHIPFLDEQSNHRSFAASLFQLMLMMKASPRRAPIVIVLDIKAATSEICTTENVHALHNQILKYIPNSWILRPKHVFSDAENPRENILERGGWPLFGSLRGSVAFYYWTYDAYNEVCGKKYTELYTHEEQVMFTRVASLDALVTSLFIGMSSDLPEDDIQVFRSEARIIRYDINPTPYGSDPTIQAVIAKGVNMIASHINFDDWCLDVLLPKFDNNYAKCYYAVTGAIPTHIVTY